MRKLWNGYRENVLVQSIFTLLLLCTCCTIWLVPVFRGEPIGEIPPLLAVLVGTVTAFYFKSQNAYNAGVVRGQSVK